MALLFDREQIDAKGHLSYLWLMVSEAQQSGLAPHNTALVSRKPVASGAHLKHWRCAVTAPNRARLYVTTIFESIGRKTFMISRLAVLPRAYGWSACLIMSSWRVAEHGRAGGPIHTAEQCAGVDICRPLF